MNDKIEQIQSNIYQAVSANGTVGPTELILIDRLSFNVYTVIECERNLLKEGFVLDGLHGKKEHPSVAVKNKAEAKIRESLILLGLDAASKSKEKDKAATSEFITQLIGG
ncbi:P27 family phage terminase small subunit [Alteribacter aurantiacus]|uniref:P27 family phage terminase small subunit n=1 Tax=Alteribacter aurantiacus TaxID=254410 RepID=UPI000415EE5D|nr:P27 family phage terminase small subunit [Alteribacter aurantiacus]